MLQTSVAGRLPHGMDSNSQSQLPPTGVKKARRAPQLIDETTWKAVEAAICIGGLGYSEAGRKFGIEPHAIMGKARRNNWPLPSMIQKRAEALQKARYKAAERYKPYEEARNGNEKVIEAVAESWAEKGEAHRALAFQIATSELKKVAGAPPPVDSWRDVDVLDRIGRRSCGLDDSERNQSISIRMQLIEARLLAIDLPKDALSGMPGCEPGVA